MVPSFIKGSGLCEVASRCLPAKSIIVTAQDMSQPPIMITIVRALESLHHGALLIIIIIIIIMIMNIEQIQIRMAFRCSCTLDQSF